MAFSMVLALASLPSNVETKPSILFSHILGIIVPIDVHIFQRGSNHQPGTCLYFAAFRRLRKKKNVWFTGLHSSSTSHNVAAHPWPLSAMVSLASAAPLVVLAAAALAVLCGLQFLGHSWQTENGWNLQFLWVSMAKYGEPMGNIWEDCDSPIKTWWSLIIHLFSQTHPRKLNTWEAIAWDWDRNGAWEPRGFASKLGANPWKPSFMTCLLTGQMMNRFFGPRIIDAKMNDFVSLAGKIISDHVGLHKYKLSKPRFTPAKFVSKQPQIRIYAPEPIQDEVSSVRSLDPGPL